MNINIPQQYKNSCILEDSNYMAIVNDILSNPAIQSMDNFIQHGETSCLSHSLAVSYISYQVCLKRGLDHVSAARAGLMHDMFLYDWHNTPFLKGKILPHGYTHPRSALKNAEMFFEVSKKEKDMILKHMWPMTLGLPKSKEAFILCMVDKMCSTREMFNRPLITAKA